MKIASLITVAAFFLTITAEYSVAQVRSRPAPTGQIARPASGQPARPFAGYQPKPTGQIAPAGSVQISGAPVTAQPAQTIQPGMVPKVNTNQDPRTFPERYQPDAGTQPQEVLSTLETQVIQQQQQNPASTTTTTTGETSTVTPGEQTGTTTTTTTQPTSPGQQAVPTQSTTTTQQKTSQKSPSQIQSIQPQNAVPASPKRVEPK
jgi:hypothetical protein